MENNENKSPANPNATLKSIITAREIDDRWKSVQQMYDMLHFRSENIMAQLKYAKGYDDEYFMTKFKLLIDFRNRITKLEDDLTELEMKQLTE